MKFSAWALVFFLIFGCTAAVKKSTPGTESRRDAESALESVVGAISGREMAREDLRDLTKQIRTDKDARSAVEAVTGAMQGSIPIGRYCPVTGQRYSPKFKTCPVHGVELRQVK